MQRDTDEAKAKALRKRIADPSFRRAMSTNGVVYPNVDFAELLSRLEIAEAEFNEPGGQSEEPLDLSKT